MFTFFFDEDFKEEFEQFGFSDNESTIFVPIDYYKASWKTCAGHSYTHRSCPIKNILIDNSSKKDTLFNSYAKRIFQNYVALESRTLLSHHLKSSFSNFLEKHDDLLNIGDYSLGIDENKTYIEQILELKSSGIPIQNMGKGTENLIRTEIALEAKSELVLFEEPENHLSYLNTRKLLSEIRNRDEHSQLILTTHSPLIVSRLDLRNTIWIQNEKSYSLKNISKSTAAFFEKTDNMNVLHYILSKKIILVEGHAEYILLPRLVKNTFRKSLDEYSIDIISGGGLTYKHYIELTKVIKNKLLVLTDNDGEKEKIIKFQEENDQFEEENIGINICCDSDIENNTFEVCIFNENSELLSNISDRKPKTKAEYRSQPCDKNLAFMLKNKTEAALIISEEAEYKNNTVLPEYMKEGIHWLIQD